jgi:GAF domain-containing protein
MRRAAAIVFLAAPPLLMLIACGLNAWAGRPWSDPLLWAPLAFACAAVGSLLWVRRAGGAIAGLFIYMGIGLPISILVEAYAKAAMEHGLAGASWAAVLFQASLALSLSFYLILQIFPTGGPLSPRWRILVWLTAAAGLLLFVTSALGATSEFKNNFPGIAHPLDVLPAGITQALDDIGGMATIVLFLASAVEIVLRYRRSTGDQRAQMKWFTAAATIAAGGFLVGFVLRPDNPSLAFALLTPLIPIAAGIAILKYRLYDIDVVISKTVVVAMLAVFIAAVYTAIVVGIGSLAGSTTSPALSIAATVLVAVLFQPVRLRARRLANRLVYGERATPYEVIAGFSERVADAVSTDRVLPQMAEAVGRGVGAVEASVRVRLPGGLERAEHWSGPVVDPDRVGAPWTVTVGYQGEPVGDLVVTKPANDPLTPAEQDLLRDLAAQAGLALHNVRLTEELGIRLGELDEQAAALRVSRERLVTARDAQRRGLQRDIHEGPERQLLDIRQRLHGVDEPEELDELIVHANDTLDGLRDLARGIFPPLLAEQGIVAALRAHIRKVGANATVESGGGGGARAPDQRACVPP